MSYIILYNSSINTTAGLAIVPDSGDYTLVSKRVYSSRRCI
jgi:hypothetical protein